MQTTENDLLTRALNVRCLAAAYKAHLCVGVGVCVGVGG